MLFNSFQFAFFFIIVTSLYFVLPHKWRWALLLSSSCYFYMSFVPVYILILAFTIVIDYFAGILIERSIGKSRKLFLVMSLIANIGVLAYFKYFNFLNLNLSYLLNHVHYKNPFPYLKMILPIGLSFHTFQAMSYTLEVYRGKQKAETHFGIYALYVMFYPQLVAGPIERPQNILHQFYEKHFFNYDDATDGLKLMLWGFYKKLVVADRIGIYVNTVYSAPQHQSGITLFVSMILFSFQIYCDFSGYSDIAIGAAKVMGFNLMTNFNTPFSSKSITEFWRRWHISLSTWFNDYLFTPLTLATRDWGKLGVILALIITFSISGLWHGAGWTFIIYGVMHGIAISYEFLTKKIRKKLSKNIPGFIYNPISIVLTFLFVSFSWVFFRANNINDAFYIIKSILQFKTGGLFYNDQYHVLIFPVIGILLLLLIEHQLPTHQHKNFTLFTNRSLFVKNIGYAALVIIILLIGVFDGGQFIYFQF